MYQWFEYGSWDVTGGIKMDMSGKIYWMTILLLPSPIMNTFSKDLRFF